MAPILRPLGIALPDAPDPTPITRPCPACGFRNNPRWKTCERCGARLRQSSGRLSVYAPSDYPPDTRRCAACGFPNGPRWETCGRCGARLRQPIASSVFGDASLLAGGSLALAGINGIAILWAAVLLGPRHSLDDGLQGMVTVGAGVLSSVIGLLLAALSRLGKEPNEGLCQAAAVLNVLVLVVDVLLVLATFSR
jgi:hypothetical protein